MKNFILALVEALKEFLSTLNTNQKYNPKPEKFRNEMVLETALKEIGVKEYSGPASNPRVDKYFDAITATGDSHYQDDTPWCAAFVGAILKWSMMGHSGKLNARSYLQWGVSSKREPWPGDVCVLWRVSPRDWRGHVGFVVKVTNDHVYLVGGNQSNEVNVSRYSKSRVLDYRRSSKHRSISASERERLNNLAERLMRASTVRNNGSLV
jgi:uncharacterized protein (TIGR02594 family)